MIAAVWPRRSRRPAAASSASIVAHAAAIDAGACPAATSRESRASRVYRAPCARRYASTSLVGSGGSNDASQAA